MNQIKLKERLENAFEAFFNDEKIKSNNSLAFIDNAEIVQIEEGKSFTKKYKTVLKVLKQVLLFFPATFFTFYTWMGMMIFGLPTLKVPFFILLLIFSPILMVLGMGNIRNLRHWIMPASVIILGSLIGLGMTGFPILRSFILDFNNAILFFPLALILAVLSKNWLESREERSAL